MTLEQLIGGLVGAAFGIRAFDANKPLWARVAYGAVGFDLLYGVFKGVPAQQPASVGQSIGDASAASINTRSVRGATIPLNFSPRTVKTIDERVSYVHEQMLKGVRDPKVYGLARAVLSKKCGDGWCVKERDYPGEFRACFNEVRSRIRYTWDPTTYDAFQTPGKTLDLGTGDCDDQVSLLGAMLMSIGHKVRSRVVQTKGFSTWNHIYLVANLPETKEWVPLDPTVDKPAGWEVPADYVIKKRDFDVVEGKSPEKLNQ